jgi:uncharacterized protein YbaR (Trm112 family)
VRPDLPELLPLICPKCRTRSERGRELHTVSLERTLATDERGHVLEGRLRCDNHACRREWPIVDGIPILVPCPAAFMRQQIAQIVERDLHPETAALLAREGADHDPYPHLVEHLSIYLDAHWGDRAEPAPDGPGPRFGMQALAEQLRARAALKVERAVELGASVGRGLAELAPGAALTVGVDLHFGALRRARRLLAGEPLPYARKQAGRHYSTAIARAGDRVAPEVALVCGDALDPPLVPQTFDRVAALNLLDAVQSPAQLLSVVDGLCRAGGELLLASPYSWQSGIVGEAERLGAHDPAGEVRRRLREGDGLETPYVVEDEADVTWWLRRDARSGHSYSVHWLRARKPR